MNEVELGLLVESLRLMALELGLKYLNDYIIDNPLYRVEYELENLHKARRQFKFVTEVEENYDKLTQIVEEVKTGIKGYQK